MATNTVSGPSACWALIALGVNAAFFHCGADEYPSEVPFSPAMMSPFICAADFLVTLSWLVYGTYNGLGIAGAAHLFVEDFKISEDELRFGVSLTQVAIILVTLNTGAITQAVKLLAFQNVPWVQTFAGLVFIAAPVTRIIVNTLARSTTQGFLPIDFELRMDELRMQKVYLRRIHLADILYDVGYVIQLHFFLALACTPGSMIPSHLGLFITCVPWDLEVGVNLGKLIAAGSIRAEDIILGMTTFLGESIYSPFLPACVIAWLLTLLPLLSPLGIDIYFNDTYVRTTLVTALGSLGTALVLVQTRLRDQTLNVNQSNARDLVFRWNPILSFTHARPRLRKILSWVFAISNLVFVALYYGLEYDPKDTIKPAWTEYLG